MNRMIKQLLYGILFLVVFGLVFFPVYRLFVPAPSCSDGIQNQQEEGVDCGAVCGLSCAPTLQSMIIHPIELIANSDGSYDAIAQLDNDNTIYGASRVDYRLDVSDAGGAVVATRRGTSYANPLEPHYLVFALGKLSTVPTSANVSVDPSLVQWTTLAVDAAGQAEFAVRNDVLIPSDGGLRYQATVLNRSRFDFDAVDIVVLLEDANGQIVGAGSTVARTVRAGEERGFTVDWPFAVPTAVRARAMVSTNLFSNDNYIREYGTQGRVPGF